MNNNTEVKAEVNEIALNIPGILLEILKKIWIVILAAAVFAGGTFLYLKNTYVPSYQTKTGIFVKGNEDFSLAASMQIATNSAKDYELLIKDPIVLNEVSEKLKSEGVNVNANALAGSISVVCPENTRIIYITLTWGSQENIAKIANTISEVAIKNLWEITEVEAKIISEAPKPTAPIPPTYKKTAIIVGVVGAIMAALIIAVIFVFEDKISSRKDIEERLGLSVLGVIPNAAKDRKGISYYSYKYYKAQYKAQEPPKDNV